MTIMCRSARTISGVRQGHIRPLPGKSRTFGTRDHQTLNTISRPQATLQFFHKVAGRSFAYRCR